MKNEGTANEVMVPIFVNGLSGEKEKTVVVGHSRTLEIEVGRTKATEWLRGTR